MPYIAISESSATLITSGNLGAPLTSTGETLGSLTDELLLQLGKREDVNRVRCRLWINFSYRALCTSLDIDDLKGSMNFDLVAGQPLYKLPREVRATRGISVIDTVTYGDSGGRPLTKSDLMAYRLRSNLSEEPREYFRERNVLGFWPTPKSIRTVTMDFWIQPADLVNETDSPILPVEWHETILINARKKGYSALQDFEKSSLAQNDFVENVREKTGRDEQEDDERIILSSVPRRRSQLVRRSANRFGENDEL